MKTFIQYIFEEVHSIHFDIHHDKNKSGEISKTRFVEKPHRGFYKRMDGLPLTYTYNHKSGNMHMSHPELYATREILSRSETGQKNGAKPAKSNDVHYAHDSAVNHFNKYKGDNMSYVGRALAAKGKQSKAWDNYEKTEKAEKRKHLRVVK